jgi:hypothetical protein
MADDWTPAVRVEMNTDDDGDEWAEIEALLRKWQTNPDTGQAWKSHPFEWRREGRFLYFRLKADADEFRYEYPLFHYVKLTDPPSVRV